MTPRLKSSFAAVSLLFLTGCGGEGAVSNPAYVRFFNAIPSTTTNTSTGVRVYVGPTLLDSNGVGPNYGYGGSFGYAKGSSGTVTITAQSYITSSTVYGTLSSQDLVIGRHYTVIGVQTAAATSSALATTALEIYTDGIAAPDSSTLYFRVIDASATHTPLYVTLSDSSGAVVYQNTSTFGGTTSGGLTIGGSTGYQSLGGTDPGSYTLRVYNSTDLSDSLGSATVTLNQGTPTTMVMYDSANNTSNLSIKSGTDSYN